MHLRRLPLVWRRRLCSDEFFEKSQPSETRQNKTIKKQTFSLSTRHSDEARRHGEEQRQAGWQAGDKGMSLLCRRHHLHVYPPAFLLALSLFCHSALHFDNGNAPSGYALNFWLALPYPNWLTTHKQTSPSPRSHAHLSLSASSCCCLHLRAQVAVIIVQFHWLAMTIAW